MNKGLEIVPYFNINGGQKDMSENLSAFFAQNAEQPKEVVKEISSRFKNKDGEPIPFVFKAITPAKDTEIQNKSIIKKPILQGPKKGQFNQEFDAIKYQLLMTIESIVFPNLKDVELQNSYGVMGEEELYNAMLLPAESVKAYEAAQKANGYEHEMKDLVEDVKNS